MAIESCKIRNLNYVNLIQNVVDDNSQLSSVFPLRQQ